MKNVAIIAFVIGIIFMVLSVILSLAGVRIRGISNINFTHFAIFWVLVCIASFLNTLCQELSQKKE
ncbi:hypothetical protein KAW65_08280 [candidate division WOR-3 bacterium]|nr:hypothetical protein [candidate division WOR-3 bacterium]